MKRTPIWCLILMVALVLVVTGCGQSTPESPQEAVEEKVAELSLAGTSWEVESFGGPDDTVPVLPDVRPTVNYLVERYAGSGGCNWYVGVYSTDGSSLRMQTPATTRTICELPEVNEQEALFMTSLLNVTEYKIEGDKLMAYTVEDQLLVTFVPLQPVPVEGTTWILKFIYNGKEWQPAIPGSPVTAQFEGDQMSGLAGCNTYQAAVTIEGETMTIGEAASTRKACAEPEGVMDQETMLLSMLPSVAGYATAGHALALLDADGQAILMFGVE
jgi:heat shock protein HslJ